MKSQLSPPHQTGDSEHRPSWWGPAVNQRSPQWASVGRTAGPVASRDSHAQWTWLDKRGTGHLPVSGLLPGGYIHVQLTCNLTKYTQVCFHEGTFGKKNLPFGTWVISNLMHNISIYSWTPSCFTLAKMYWALILCKALDWHCLKQMHRRKKLAPNIESFFYTEWAADMLVLLPMGTDTQWTKVGLVYSCIIWY